MISKAHSAQSSYREILLEHLFLGDLLRDLWKRGAIHVEVLKPQVDDAGYDIALECRGVLRHIQLKSSHSSARRANVDIHIRLGAKRSGCVIWIFFDPDTLKLGPFLWFGGPPGSPLPDIRDFKVAKHTKADATGHKAERPNIRLIRKGQFEKLDSIPQVIEKLFGSLPSA